MFIGLYYEGRMLLLLLRLRLLLLVLCCQLSPQRLGNPQ